MKPQDHAMLQAVASDIIEMRKDFDALLKQHIQLAGHVEAYRGALLSVIVAHPSHEMDAALRLEMAKQEANLVSACEAEDYVHGVQEAQKLIVLALDEARKVSAQRWPPKANKQTSLFWRAFAPRWAVPSR